MPRGWFRHGFSCGFLAKFKRSGDTVCFGDELKGREYAPNCFAAKNKGGTSPCRPLSLRSDTR